MYDQGHMASTAISKNFSTSKHRKIPVLPFQNSGKGGADSQIADKLSLKLMERGFTIVERSQLERVFEELKLFGMNSQVSGRETPRLSFHLLRSLRYVDP